MNFRRLMFWPPWRVTRPWLPRVICGGDEWHNRSVGAVVPFLGAVIVFVGPFSRDGEQHLNVVYNLTGEWEGAWHPECPVCSELLQKDETWMPGDETWMPSIKQGQLLVEAEIVLEDGSRQPIVVAVTSDRSGACRVRGHSRPIDLPPGASLSIPWDDE